MSCNSDVLNVLSEGTPLYDFVCKRSLNFIRTCLSSSNAVIKLVACHGITYSHMFSVLGRNIQFCSDGCRVCGLTNLSFNVSIINSACKGDSDPELCSRSQIAWELLMVRDGLIGLLGRHFL